MTPKVRANRKTLRAAEQEARRKQFRLRYEAYMASDKWAFKRTATLIRDDYTCQACLKRAATQVHHKTYDHFGAEPLFDLVSVCDQCHEQITAMDRERRPW